MSKPTYEMTTFGAEEINSHEQQKTNSSKELEINQRENFCTSSASMHQKNSECFVWSKEALVGVGSNPSKTAEDNLLR